MDLVLKRLGLRKKEKILVIEYEVPSTSKKYHHEIKLK